MLFISTSWALLQSHAIICVADSPSPVLKMICRIGIRAAKENTFNITDRILNTTDAIRYFLYGGTNLRNTLMNSFMLYRL